MGKLLVRISVPAISDRFDIWVPDFLPIRELIPLIVETLEQMTRNAYASSHSEVLCLTDPQRILPEDGTLKSLGVRNGEQLILI